MLQKTYEVLARKASELKEQLYLLKSEQDLSVFRKEWKAAEFEPEKCRAGAEDGSVNYRRFRSIILYVLNSAVVLYTTKLEVHGEADIDFLYPYRYVRDRLSLYMGILELKTALQHLDKVDIMLLDGSLYSALVSPRELFSLSREKREDLMDMLREIENNNKIEIVSRRLALEGDLEDEAIYFLEYAEYLNTILRLIEKGMDKVVGISKTSSDTKAGVKIPYMAGFEEITHTTGFSAIYQEPIRRSFPLYGEFFNSIVFSKFYARLEPKKNVLMFEVPREIDEEEAHRILNRVSFLCIDGYPYLLRKAHSQVVIKNKDIDHFASAIGITEPTGREVVE